MPQWPNTKNFSVDSQLTKKEGHRGQIPNDSYADTQLKKKAMKAKHQEIPLQITNLHKKKTTKAKTKTFHSGYPTHL